MRRKQAPHFTDAELPLMEVLWKKGSATVTDILLSLSKPPSAYSTVITLLRILEGKGYVRHEKQGRSFVYEPLVDRHAARETAVTHLLRRFFEGSPELLMLNLLESQ